MPPQAAIWSSLIRKAPNLSVYGVRTAVRRPSRGTYDLGLAALMPVTFFAVMFVSNWSAGPIAL